MDEARFWTTIDEARGAGAGSKTPSADPERLRAILSAMPDEDVAAFGSRFDQELVRLRRWSIWGAGYVIHGGMGDDSFHYFCSWLVGKGKAAVERALSDSDGLGDFVEDPEEVDNELLEYVAVEILEARGLGDPRSDDVEGDPGGEPFDEETVGESYPALAAAFGFEG